MQDTFTGIEFAIRATQGAVDIRTRSLTVVISHRPASHGAWRQRKVSSGWELWSGGLENTDVPYRLRDLETTVSVCLYNPWRRPMWSFCTGIITHMTKYHCINATICFMKFYTIKVWKLKKKYKVTEWTTGTPRNFKANYLFCNWYTPMVSKMTIYPTNHRRLLDVLILITASLNYTRILLDYSPKITNAKIYAVNML